jgi:hypothetical protein
MDFDGPARAKSNTDTYLIEFIRWENKEEKKATSNDAKYQAVLLYRLFLRTVIGPDLRLTTSRQASHLTKAVLTLGNAQSIIQLKYILHRLRHRHTYSDDRSLSRLETLQRISAHLRKHTCTWGPFGAFVRRFLATEFYRLLQCERDASGAMTHSVSEPAPAAAETDPDKATLTALLRAAHDLENGAAEELRARFLVWRRVGRRCLALQQLYGPGILALLPHRAVQSRGENQTDTTRSCGFSERIFELSDEGFEALHAHLKVEPDPWLKVASGFIQEYVSGLGRKVMLPWLWLEVVPKEDIARFRERSAELLDLCSCVDVPQVLEVVVDDIEKGEKRGDKR